MNRLNNELIVSTSAARPTRFLGAILLAAFAVAVLVGSALAANIVSNGSFEKDGDGDGIPNNWAGFALTTADKRVCNQSQAGNCSFKLVGDGNAKQLRQYFGSGSAGDEFDFSVWAKGKGIVTGAGYARVSVYFYHTACCDFDIFSLDIPEGNSPWTKQQVHVVATENYTSVSIWLESDFDSGKMWVDKVKLVEAP
jgi:hypothetical protein